MTDIAVIASAGADVGVRSALERACERIPATPSYVADDDRIDALRRLARQPGIDWIAIVDADAVLAADAFGRLRRSLASSPALLGGRGMIGGRQHFGAMFAQARCGPYPFEIALIAGLAEERGLFDIIRGPVDVPQRGAFVVSAAFVRSLPGEADLDPVLLFLDLAVQARVAGATVLCEPTLSFVSDEDGVTVKRHLLNLRRYAAFDVWEPATLHREPASLRSLLIDRDTRVMGNFRGYAKRQLPPIETITYGPRDADAVRAALARTGDRYVLLVPSGTTIARATIERLVERIECSSRYAIALERAEPPYGAVLVHGARMVAGGRLRGDTCGAIFADAIAQLPGQRLAAIGPDGPILPASLPPLPSIATLDVIFVAASQPVVTNQTVQALLQHSITGVASAVFPAGAETTRRLLSSFGEFRLVPDASDPILAVGLNRAIAASRADAIAIVRDDVQITNGTLERMSAAFSRVARLGVAVPRTGGGERLEGIPEITYGNAVEMQTFAERRAELYAREAMLADVATTPMLVVAREVFEIVGGFREEFGFSRFGIEDFTRRARLANFHVARCDDAYVHMFPSAEVQSFLAPLDLSATLFGRYRERRATVTTFDPARDAVKLPPVDAPAPAAGHRPARVRLLVPVANEDEWTAIEPQLAPFFAAFGVNDPVDVAIGLDGSLAIGVLVARLRELLVRTGVSIEETVNVIVERAPALDAWRDAHAGSVRLAACDREALAALPVVGDPGALRVRLLESEPA